MSYNVRVPLALLAGVAITAAVASVAPVTTHPIATRHITLSAASGAMLAPYVDMGATELYPIALGAIDDAGLRGLTAGFVISGGGCKPAWDNGVSVATDTSAQKFLRTARTDGASEILSFGGAGGRKLSETCGSAKQLAATYESVATEFKTWRLDFDIEGHELADRTAVVKEIAALHQLQRAHPMAKISLTVPAALNGLPGQVKRLLTLAAHAKLNVPLVNLMTMDFGGNREMGKATVTSLTKALPQLRRIYPKAGWRDLGATPMIGINDVRSEVFTVNDALTLASFDFDHQLGRLSFWDIGRDQPCSHHETKAEYNCSGTSQQEYAFTTMLS